MSGLAVLFHRDRRPVERASIQLMLDAIPHRGLDGAWLRVFPATGVGLGFAKLAVTPEEATEQQPLVSPRTGCALIADARLDNRQELLTLLPDRVHPALSDAELILRAYEAWGEDTPKHLLGDFALVIWDPREQRLVLARDTSGQRTLFLRDDGRTFAAASELHQLLQDPTVLLAPNENRIRDFLVPVNVFRNAKEQTETFYAGIFAVPAGHTLVVDREGTRSSQYWAVNPGAELHYRSDQEYAEHFRSLFFDVVQARLRSSRPIAATLSGGLDSASIVCAAQELYRQGGSADRGFTSFSMVFDGLDCDERPLIEDTQAKYGFEASYIQPKHFVGPLNLQPRHFAEEPPTGFGAGADELITAVFERGARVLLTGDIADAYVGGSRLVFDSHLRQGHLGAFLRDMRIFRGLADESLVKTLVMACLGPLLLPMPLLRLLTATHGRRYLHRNWDKLVPTWLVPDVQEDLRQRHLAAVMDMARNRRFSSPAREEQYQMLYPPPIARDYVGWPVELWRPFADRRLHEFMLAIPPEQHFQPHPETDEYYAGSKRLLREGLRGVLPESIRTLTNKVGFSSVYTTVLEQSWPAYEAAFGPSARPLVAQRGYIDQQQFWSRLEQLRDGKRGADFVYMIRVIGLETWLRGFAEPRAQLVTIPDLWRTRTRPLTHGVSPGEKVPAGVS